MSLSNFSNDYLDRTAGLRNFVAPPPPFIDSNGQPVSSPGSGSAMSALATLLPPQDVTAPAPANNAPSGMQSFAEKDPTGKAMDIANEAYQPGYIAKSDQMASQSAATPFRDTGLGALAAGLIPGLSTSFARERGQALADFWSQHVGDNPTAQNIVGAMKADPLHARDMLPTLMQEIDPAHAAEGQEAQDKLKSKRGLQALFGQEAETQTQPGTAPSTQITPAQPSPAAGYDPRVVAQLESSGGKNNVNPQNPNVQGPLQFDPSTAARVGLKNPGDMQESLAAAQRLGSMNAQEMTPALGRAPTPQELYLAHQQGATGAAALIKNPSANAVSALVAAGVPQDKALKSITQNGGTADMTAQQFAQLHEGRYDAAAKAIGSPAPVQATSNMPQPAGLSQFSDYAARLQHEQELRVKAAAIDPSLAPLALAGKGTLPPPTAETAAGKAKIDLDKGLITPAQYQMIAGNGILQDSGLTGTAAMDALKAQNPMMAQKVQLMLQGKMPVSARSSSGDQAQIMALAQQIDPSFTPQAFKMKQQTLDEFSPAGQSGKMLSSINTLASHAKDLIDAHNAMKNRGVESWNAVANATEAALGNSDMQAARAKWDQAVEAVAPEAAKIATGSSSPAQAEIESRREKLHGSMSDASFNSAMNEILSLIKGAADSKISAYQQAMGGGMRPDTFKPFSPAAVEIFKKYGVDLAGGDHDLTKTEETKTAAADSGAHEDLMQYMTPEEKALFKK